MTGKEAMEILLNERKKKGINLYELARRINVPPATLHAAEHRGTILGTQNFFKAANVLGIHFIIPEIRMEPFTDYKEILEELLTVKNRCFKTDPRFYKKVSYPTVNNWETFRRIPSLHSFLEYIQSGFNYSIVLKTEE